jgi:transposase InsO family protein
VHKKSHGLYGRPRIYNALKNKGLKVSETRVYRLMKKAGIYSIMRRKFKATTNSHHNLPVAPNLLNRDFTATKPNQKWVGDITYIPTNEGWLYLAMVLDLYDKKVVGWSMDKTMTKELVINAFNSAIKRRTPKPALIMHTDRGSQYCSKDYQEALEKYWVLSSMSRKGNCWDNACAESFFGTLKTELVYLLNFDTRESAKSIIFQYIEVFYNNQRLHSSLGYLSPKDFANKSKTVI